MIRKQSLDQFIARDEHPEWVSAEGRVYDEIVRTLGQFARGEQPTTVLAGLIIRGSSDEDPTVYGKSVGHIASLLGGNPFAPNHRGDTISDTLQDLVEVGLCTSNVPTKPLERLRAKVDGELPVVEEFRLVT
jgi:hypothetical protein